MKIVCPHCNFSRDVPEDRLPDRPVKATCPSCRQGFAFDRSAPGGTTAPGEAAPAGEEQTTCPVCGLVQLAGDSCAGCGLIYAKWEAHRRAQTQSGSSFPPAQAEAAFPGREAYLAAAPETLPKAGFWIRVGASLLDTVLLVAVQFAIEAALGLAAGETDELAMAIIGGLCSMVVSLTYYIFFTGYNGQTPGKMALRIRVIRTDGTPMSYGRAFLREVIGKFLSGIILGIGYLMVAFDRNKQGLHDRIAGTYVIKL